MNEMLAGMGAENANKTTDANSGSYALELSTSQDLNSGDTISGFISMGAINFNGPTPFLPTPYLATPTTFSGSYKYSPVNGDIAAIQIQFLQGGATIGFHQEPLNVAGSYTTFSSPLTIAGTPDSIVFIAFSGENPGSVLILDDLSFSGGDVSVEEFAKMSASIYPNPAKEVVMVKAEGNYTVEIINILGERVYTRNGNQGVQSIDLTSFTSGSYIVKIYNSTSIESLKLIVE
jgi:hypothetical protein